MTKRATVIGVVLALAALAWLIIVNLPPREPVARGKPLSYWIVDLNKSVTIVPGRGFVVGPNKSVTSVSGGGSPAMPYLDMTERQKAGDAIREIGTNALPALERMLRRRDSPMRKQFVSWVSNHPWLQSRIKLRPSADEDCSHALGALNWLGPLAKTALPDVLPLMMSSNYTVKMQAFQAFAAIGPDIQMARPVIPVLTNALADPGIMRMEALHALASIRPVAPEARLGFAQLFHESDRMTREMTKRFLLAGTNAIMLPVLDELLHDKDSFVVTVAASQIGFYGAAAAESVPRLTELLQDPLLTVRDAATNALIAITGQPLTKPAPVEKAEISYNFPLTPVGQLLDIYEGLAGKRIMMVAQPNLGQTLHVKSDRLSTKSEALQLLEEAFKEQAGFLIVHEQDGFLTAVHSAP